MNISFQPLKLAEVAQKIRHVHNDNAELSNSFQSLGKKFVTKVAELHKENISDYADLLADYKLEYIAAYIPSNLYNVDLSNLVIIFKRRISEKTFDIFYHSWQKCYDNGNVFVKYLLRDCISDDKKCLDRYFEATENLNVALGEWLKSDDLISAICKSAMTVKNNLEIDFSDAVKRFKIEESRLYDAVLRSFYLYCNFSDYQKCEPDSLLQIITGYNQEELLLFYLNLLNCSSKKDISNFDFLWDKAYALIGYPHNYKYNRIFTEKVKRKFSNAEDVYNFWHIIRQVDVFEKGKRGKFWKLQALNFDALECRYYSKFHAIYMKFNGGYVVEFSDDTKSGALYFFTTNYFVSNIEKIFQKGFLSEKEFKGELLRHNKKEDFPQENRIEHRGQSKEKNWMDRAVTNLEYLTSL